MKTFHYYLNFSPYQNQIRVRNKKHAWELLEKMWPEYDVKKVVTLF